MTNRVLLIGATGAFGSRLARMLTRVPGIALIVTSRDQKKAEALALALQTASQVPVSARAFQHGPTARSTLHETRPWLVIDASGPFQTANYETAHATLEAGAHWIDLADAAGYILGFPAGLEDLARGKKLCAFTGASSTPALSCAVVASLTQGWHRVDDVDIAIYPAGGGDVGEAVIRAVLSYAGQSVAVCRDGQTQSVTGWGEAHRTLVPGLGARYRSPVATADYALMPQAFGARNVGFYAGLESTLEHLGLVALAQLGRYGWLRHLTLLPALLHKARRLTSTFCGANGAMAVRVKGVDRSGRTSTAQWMLTARCGDGPNVPVLAALALTKKLLAQEVAPQASHAARILSLAEIEREMAPFALTTERQKSDVTTKMAA